MHEGLVTRTEGQAIWVLLNGEERLSVLRGRLKKEQIRTTALVVVGDRVIVDESGAICEIAPRQSELCRPGFRNKPHPMAANVDLLLIVQSAREPGFNRHLTERFMAMATRGGVRSLVVVTKADLTTEAEVASWLQPLGEDLPFLLTSTLDGRGIPELRSQLQGRMAVMAGPSGAGKSSLLNALYPGFAARVGAVSQVHTKGKHTTTSSRLYPLPDGGFLADTPGIRTLALFEDADSVEEVFAEIQALGQTCRFRNCSHTSEPDCAVQSAVAAGEVDADRLAHYLRLRKGR